MSFSVSKYIFEWKSFWNKASLCHGFSSAKLKCSKIIFGAKMFFFIYLIICFKWKGKSIVIWHSWEQICHGQTSNFFYMYLFPLACCMK